MKIIHKYVAKTVISTIVLVIFILVAVELFINFSQEFGDMGLGNYDFLHVMLVTFMLLPGDLYQFIPVAGLVGSLLALSLLASRSELVVMRSSGISIREIMYIVLKAALLVVILAVILGEIIAPIAQHTARIYKAKAISQGQAIKTTHGIWLRSGKSYLNIGNVASNTHLININRYRFKNNKLISTSHAEEAIYQNGNWLFKNINQTNFSRTIQTKKYKQEIWQLKFKPKLLHLINISSDEKSLPQLYNYIKYLKKNKLAYNKYAFDFWQRIFQPIATLAMILLAIPFMFGPLRSSNMGLRMLIGTSLGLAFWMINQFIGPITATLQLSPLLIASLPTVTITVLAGILLLI
ncbi:MAG: LPS export ABC transporter permease LptG [Gammaproteobacteria bacterium]|nr:LPS export ABC transporter permease LptG [Gammaproteobacteria bacterium]